MAESDRSFQLVVHGTVESAECTTVGNMVCKSSVVIGPDWSYVVQGGGRANTVDVVTQLAERKPGAQALFTWNTPFEFVLEGTTPAGWPQLALAAVTIDAAGKEVVVGYARCHVPRKSGSYTVTLRMLEPVHSTAQHKLIGAATGKKPEIKDPAFLCSPDDHAFLTAKAVEGHIRVSFDIALVNFEALGFK